MNAMHYGRDESSLKNSTGPLKSSKLEDLLLRFESAMSSIEDANRRITSNIESVDGNRPKSEESESKDPYLPSKLGTLSNLITRLERASAILLHNTDEMESLF